MKIMTKSISLLLTLAMCVSLIFGVNTPASAATYVYNWGERGTVATYLSDYAENFYADNNTSYDELASLMGSSSESSVPSSALYKELHNLMENNHDYITSYNDTKDLFKYTDCQNGGGKISSFYSGNGIGPSWDGSWNREHTWPNSKGDAAGNGEDDLMMLRPTSTSENSSRGNKAYGQSSGYYNPNSESGGQYDLRGDVARIVLYVYVRWECTNTGSGYNPNGIFGTDGVMESKEVLLDWIEADPVDTWELGRNDAAESILGTRNVFVDYPELAFLLYNEEIPSDYTTPSGNAQGVSYTITASSNNTSWGTVSVSGKTINAIPKDGYEVSGYEVLSGEAIVTRSGNAFSVDPSSDVSIKINFTARSQKTITFSENNDVVDLQTVYSGDVITLPSNTNAVDEGNLFLGWVEESIEETTEIPQYYTAGSEYTVTADVTMYALYSKNVSDGGTNSNVFEKYSGALVEGDYLITYENNDIGAMNTSKNGGKNRLDYSVVTVLDNTITTADDDIIWHIAPTGDGYWTIYNASVSQYVANSGTGNYAVLSDTVTDNTKWTSSGNDTYEFISLGNSRYLRRNGTFGFATYAQTTGGALTLYKRVSGTVYYFTSTSTSIDHEYDSDCDTNCNLCGEARVVNVVHNLDSNNICIDCGAELPEYSLGDIDNDGKINNRDYILIVRYLNGWDVKVSLNACDADNDGKVTGRDCVLLMQYINGWDVNLH